MDLFKIANDSFLHSIVSNLCMKSVNGLYLHATLGVVSSVQVNILLLCSRLRVIKTSGIWEVVVILMLHDQSATEKMI